MIRFMKSNVSKILECTLDYISNQHELENGSAIEESTSADPKSLVKRCIQDMAYDLHFVLENGKIIFANDTSCYTL
eukprot:Pgem_evm1s7463